MSCRISDPKWFQQLLRIDQELAEQARIAGCVCGGRLHLSNYSRKPRGCPRELRDDLSQRLSFCCARGLPPGIATPCRPGAEPFYLAPALLFRRAEAEKHDLAENTDVWIGHKRYAATNSVELEKIEQDKLRLERAREIRPDRRIFGFRGRSDGQSE